MTLQPLTPQDLQGYIDAQGLDAEIMHLPEETPTVEDAARAVGCTPDQIVKSVLFTVGDEQYLCIACGVEHVSRRKLAGRLGVGRKRIKLARPDVVLQYTGYAVGTVPPFGHLTSLTTFIDPRVLAQEEVFAGGGGIAQLVRLRASDLQAHIQAEILDLVDAS